MKESAMNSVTIPNISGEAFRNVIEYIYSDNSKLSIECVSEVYVDAGMRVLPRLQSLCLEYIKKNIHVDNVIFLSLQAFAYDSKELSDIAYPFLLANALQVFNRTDWMNVEEDTLLHFLSLTYNHLYDSTDQNTAPLQSTILTTLFKWIKKRLVNIPEGEYFHHLRKEMEDKMNYVHTFKLTPKDFAICLITSEVYPMRYIVDAFSNQSIEFNPDEECIACFASSPFQKLPLCSSCKDQGFITIISPCKCSYLGFGHYWCNFTGESKLIGTSDNKPNLLTGPPCTGCTLGKIANLKVMFDNKLLNECIRVRNK